MSQPKLKPDAIAMRIARALHDLGPGRHFDEDLREAHRNAAHAYVKPQSLPFILQLLEGRDLVKIMRRKEYTTVEMTSKGHALFALKPPPAADAAKTPPRFIAFDFSPALRTPIVSGPYIRPEGLQHTAIPSRSGSTETPYAAHT